MKKKERKSSIDWERDIYAKGMQLNRWPFSEVVSAIIRAAGCKGRNELSVLELGCGAGNNLWFLAEEGFKAHGIDLSSSAIENASHYLNRRGVHADLKVGDISSLPWADGSFDYVIDRGALTQVSYEHIEAVLVEVQRVLRDSGMMMCFTLYGLRTPDRILGTEVSKNTFDNFSGGRFSKVGLTSFFSVSDLRYLFRYFSSVGIHRHVEYDEDDQIVDEIYSLSAKK
jgi:cyclopropane fatty-acyl-phospholipid synthase-like methyltransferase